jgi:hypothetical protein
MDTVDYTELGTAALALPGRGDLTLDCDSTTLDSVVRLGDELLLRFTGGFGTFIDRSGRQVAVAPGSSGGHVRVDLVISYDRPNRHWLDRSVGLLEQWCATATPLRVCAAPRRLAMIIEHRTRWIPVPAAVAPGAPNPNV